MYKSGDLNFGAEMDSRTADYDSVQGAYLVHSCDKWVIGGKSEIEQLILDLQKMLVDNFKEKI